MPRNARWINTRLEYDFAGRLLVREGFWDFGPFLEAGGAVKNAADWAFYADGTEAGSIIIGTKNTNPAKGDIPNDIVFFYRQGVEETNGGGWMNVTVKLQYNHNSAGFVDVTASSVHVQSVATGNITDGTDTTQRITSFTHATPNGGFDEVDGIAGDGAVDLSNTGFEALWAIQIIEAQVSDDDTIILRVVQSDGTPMDNYAQTDPTIIVEVAGGGTIVSGTGTSIGSASTTGVGVTIAKSVPAVSGVSIVTGIGVAIMIATASAVGVASVNGAGIEVIPSVGTSAGVAVVTGIGAIAPNVQEGTGTSVGVATVNGIGVAIAKVTASAAGAAIITGVSGATKISTASAVGASVVTGVGKTIAKVTGTSAGVAVVTGIGATAPNTQEGTGTSAGVAVVTGIGKATKISTASAAGVAVVTGIGKATKISTASAAGVAVVTGIGKSTNISTATSIGVAIVTGVGKTIAKVTGTSAGVAVVTGIGEIAEADVQGKFKGVLEATPQFRGFLESKPQFRGFLESKPQFRATLSTSNEMASFKIFIDNDDLIWLRGFRDDVSETYETATATVTMEILNLDDTVVQNSIAMTYNVGSNGDFFGGVQDDLGLTAGKEYKAKVIATSASGVKSTFIHKFVAEERIG